MSIVGPRPLPVYEQEQCNDYQNQRLLMKPGFTCYWQVMERNDIGFNEWIELDLKYIKNSGLLTDLGTMMKVEDSVELSEVFRSILRPLRKSCRTVCR